MTGTTANIPTIDFSPFMEDAGVVIGKEATSAQLEVARQIDDACRAHGFVHLINFGLKSSLHKEMFQACDELFHLSNKSELNRISPETNMGYAPFKSESLNRSRPPDLKEAFNIRFPPVHTNKLEGCPQSFQTAVPEVLAAMKTATHRYGIACALALGIPLDFFSKHLETMDLSTVRFLFAPPCDWSCSDQQGDRLEKPVRVGEHTDFGAYTFVLYPPGANADGLQIKSVQGGEVGGAAGGEGEGWQTIELPTVEEDVVGAVVNTGALMARWTNDVWKATAHRVVIPSAELASQERLSAAVFVDPDSHSLVEVHEKFHQYGGGCRYAPITSNDYLLSKLKELMKQ